MVIIFNYALFPLLWDVRFYYKQSDCLTFPTSDFGAIDFIGFFAALV